MTEEENDIGTRMTCLQFWTFSRRESAEICFFFLLLFFQEVTPITPYCNTAQRMFAGETGKIATETPDFVFSVMRRNSYFTKMIKALLSLFAGWKCKTDYVMLQMKVNSDIYWLHCKYTICTLNDCDVMIISFNDWKYMPKHSLGFLQLEDQRIW